VLPIFNAARVAYLLVFDHNLQARAISHGARVNNAKGTPLKIDETKKKMRREEGT